MGEVPIAGMEELDTLFGIASVAFDQPSHMNTLPSAVTAAVRYLPAIINTYGLLNLGQQLATVGDCLTKCRYRQNSIQ